MYVCFSHSRVEGCSGSESPQPARLHGHQMVHLLAFCSRSPLTRCLRVELCAGNYDEYFGMATDVEAVVYLMLQNAMLHDLFPSVVTIGEDVSGMPTFCRCSTAFQVFTAYSRLLPLDP